MRLFKIYGFTSTSRWFTLFYNITTRTKGPERSRRNVFTCSAALWDPGLEVYFWEMGEGKTQSLWIPSSAVSRICDAYGTQLPGAWSWALLTTTLWAWSDRWHHFKDTETQIHNREMVSTRQRASSGKTKDSHFSCFIFLASSTLAREVHRALVLFTLASSPALWRFCTQLACQSWLWTSQSLQVHQQENIPCLGMDMEKV